VRHLWTVARIVIAVWLTGGLAVLALVAISGLARLLLPWLIAVLPPTVSPVELLWASPAPVGLVWFLWCYYCAARQRYRQHHADPPINGKLGIAATARCVRALCLAIIFLLFLLGGLYAMLLPSGPTSDPTTSDGWILGLLLWGAQVLLLLMGRLLEFYEASIVTMVALEARATRKRSREQGQT
jgi:hypothetical protein